MRFSEKSKQYNTSNALYSICFSVFYLFFFSILKILKGFFSQLFRNLYDSFLQSEKLLIQQKKKKI